MDDNGPDSALMCFTFRPRNGDVVPYERRRFRASGARAHRGVGDIAPASCPPRKLRSSAGVRATRRAFRRSLSFFPPRREAKSAGIALELLCGSAAIC